MDLLKCIGKDGRESMFQYKFQVSYEQPMEVEFTVIPFHGEYSDFFTYRIESVDQDRMKITMMTANGKDMYQGKGIPKALIHRSAVLFDRVITSSSNSKESGEYRTPDADKVWKRLVSENLALFDAEEDRYTYTGYRQRGVFDPGYEDFEPDEMADLQKYIDMPYEELMQIEPVWDENIDNEDRIVITANAEKVLASVNFLELSNEYIFNHQVGDGRFANILKRWQENEPVDPADLLLSKSAKLTINDGRHRTVLACQLGYRPLFTVLKIQKDEIEAIIT